MKLLLLIVVALMLTAQVRGYQHLRNVPFHTGVAIVNSLNADPPTYGVHKFGFNDDIDTTTAPEDLWSCPTLGSAALFQYPAVAETIFVSSDNAADTHEIMLVGLDDTWVEATQAVTLSGVSFVQVPGTWTRVFRAYNSSGTASTGNTYIHVDTVDTGADGVPDLATDFRNCFTPEAEQTLYGGYTIPAGKVGFLHKVCFNVSPSAATTERLVLQFLVRSENGVFRVQDKWSGITTGTSETCVETDVPRMYAAKTDLKIQILETQSNDGRAGGMFDLVVWDD